MTDQPEIDEFWLQEKAREIAERGKQADPTACGTCRTRVAAGQQVEHDECAQRATLMEASDQPGYEVITTMTEAEVAALPPRFHIPAFIESSTPKAWVCAVCWGDGWSSLWPCATATEHGLQVFTPQHEAETAAKKQAARIAELEKDSATLCAETLREAAEALRVEHRRIFWATKPDTCPEAEFLDRMADATTQPDAHSAAAEAGGSR
jgi:hypothetical protein